MENKSGIELSDLDEEIKFPHKFGFESELEKHNNNFFNASIHCLTNIVPFSKYILNSLNYNHEYYNLIITISNMISNFDKSKEKDSKEKSFLTIHISLLNFKKYIFSKYDNNKDPRKLIFFILKDLQKAEYIYPGFLTKIQKRCNLCKSFSQSEELKMIEFNIPKIVENSKCKNKNKLTIYDCFDDFFYNTLNDGKSVLCDKCRTKNAETQIIKFPKILFVLIDYGNNNNICYDFSYEFDENINLKNYNCLNQEDKNREYFLASSVVGKNMGTTFEIFYTFARENENSKYIIYNGNDVRENLKMTNKLKKDKINFKNKKESFPYILVYIDKNLNNEEIVITKNELLNK